MTGRDLFGKVKLKRMPIHSNQLPHLVARQRNDSSERGAVWVGRAPKREGKSNMIGVRPRGSLEAARAANNGEVTHSASRVRSRRLSRKSKVKQVAVGGGESQYADREAGRHIDNNCSR